MSGEKTIVFGVPVPSVDPVFITVVRFHIVVGIVCVLAGASAMLSHKGRGLHSTFGTLYYWRLAMVPYDQLSGTPQSRRDLSAGS